MGGGATAWAIVVPVKRLVTAKTRLAVAPDVRAELALAMALDTVTALLTSSLVRTVVAVTDDDRAAPLLRDRGAFVVADVPDAGLNPALQHGVAMAVSEHGAAAVGTVSADLPALHPAELDELLTEASAHPAVVVGDWSGSGTTLLTSTRPDELRPAYGPGSRAVHARNGAVDLTDLAGPGLRRDVDTVADLRAAVDLGCGAATSGVVARRAAALGLP